MHRALIRVAIGEDVPAMVSVINEAFAVETFIDGARTDELEVRGMMRTGEFLVAVTEKTMSASVYTEMSGERGYLGMLAVSKAIQGSGLGRLMVQAAEEHCRKRGCTYMVITVLTLRPELPPYYRKLGYVETGIIEEFHTPRAILSDAECKLVVMSKAL